MGATGLEHSHDSSGNTRVSESGGSKSGNSGPDSGAPMAADPELAAVVAAWPELPPAIRAGILAMVGAAAAHNGPQPPDGVS